LTLDILHISRRHEVVDDVLETVSASALKGRCHLGVVVVAVVAALMRAVAQSLEAAGRPCGLQWSARRLLFFSHDNFALLRVDR
jgi:hypothetical protein